MSIMSLPIFMARLTKAHRGSPSDGPTEDTHNIPDLWTYSLTQCLLLRRMVNTGWCGQPRARGAMQTLPDEEGSVLTPQLEDLIGGYVSGASEPLAWSLHFIRAGQPSHLQGPLFYSLDSALDIASQSCSRKQLAYSRRLWRPIYCR